MTRARRWLTASLIASLLSGTVSAAADPAAAEVLFDEGVQLATAGDLPRACQKFEASESLDVAVGTLLRLADCYERTGRLASAWSRFREAASLAQTQTMADRQGIATVRAEALSTRMARLSIHVPTAHVAGLRIVLGQNEVPDASWGSALPVDAGTLVLEASAPGYLPFRREVVVPVVDGARIVVTVPALERTIFVTSSGASPSSAARPALGERASARSEVVDRGYASRVVGVTFAVLGGIGLGTSGVLTLLAKRSNDASLEYCPADKHRCTPVGVQKRRDAAKQADAATVSASVGGGMLLTGLIVYWVAPKAATERVSFAIQPDLSNRGGTLRMQAGF